MAVQILSQETINKIAAGEVIERPQNVVKELVENSLDACANSISIEIEKAGRKLIRISDNGIGMSREDLELSILPHATSKILNFEDLSHLQSMGFRGEALSSIAAVSKMEIKTKQKDADNGWKLSCAGDKSQSAQIAPWEGAKGSIFEIKDLFFNTPARQKFLKSDASEKGRMINTLEEISLANNDVSFKLIIDSKMIFQSAATDKKNRISDILGADFAKTLRTVNLDHNRASIEIFYTGRQNSQPNRKYQYLFVNSRPVNIPKWLFHCLNRAYQENIEHGRYPGFLIYIVIDPAEIDINVSPTKREVRFSDENALYGIIDGIIRQGLESNFPHLDIGRKGQDAYISDVSGNSAGFENQKNSDPKHLSSAAPSYLYDRKFKGNANAIGYNIKDYAKVYKQDDLQVENFGDNIKVIGQIFESFVLAQKENDFYIFDQHAAAERVKYEAFQEQNDSKNLNIQSLLMPETFETSHSQASLLIENLQVLNDLGIRIEEFGDKTFRITGYPALLGNINPEFLVRGLLEDLEINKQAGIEQKRAIIMRAACRQSIKAGHEMSFIEIKNLILQLFKCKQPFTCPHGRPTAYIVSKTELEKYFKRT